MAMTAAEKQRAYRQRKKAFGETLAKFEPDPEFVPPAETDEVRANHRHFIALDGEGMDYGPELELVTDTTAYKYRKHKYVMIAASTGEELQNNNEALATKDVIDWLLDLRKRYRKSIFVAFAFSYDVNHILKDIARDTLQKISRGECVSLNEYLVECERKNAVYEIEYRNRKSFTIRHGFEWRQVQRGKNAGKWHKHVENRITIYDVFGYFQESFVTTVEKWLGKDYPALPMLRQMKSKRRAFGDETYQDIRDYNNMELRALTEIMDHVNEAMQNLGITPQRWDGAGAVAGAAMKKEGVAKHLKKTPDEILEAVRTSYAGGRIEPIQIGNYEKPIYYYDIASAYPAAMADMPCMACGRWECEFTPDPPPGFTMVEVKYEFQHDLPFYPLFYRLPNSNIVFPREGHGIYWYPEFAQARQVPGNLEVVRWWHWNPCCDHKPFKFVPEYFKLRQEYISGKISDDELWKRGAEKMIKLILNSLYGKTAQQLGGTAEKWPTYFQMEYAGWITSSTRAQLFSAAWKKPWSVISFATDGIFCTEELPIYVPKQKYLGEWECEIIPGGIVIAMSGVYWLRREKRVQHMSRGFDKEFMQAPDTVIDAWRARKEFVPVGIKRLITMGSACMSDNLWKMKSCFVTAHRDLTLNLSGNSKRYKIDYREKNPADGLVRSWPRTVGDGGSPYDIDIEISRPYPLKFQTDMGGGDREIAAIIDESKNEVAESEDYEMM